MTRDQQIGGILRTMKKGNRTHGRGSRSQKDPLYTKWSGMKRRCLNKNDKSYKRYGGAGVTVCEKWLKFEGFLEDMESGFRDGLSIDRIDNSKGYSKENCRWIELSQQSRNRKGVSLIEFNGKIQTIPEWEKELGFREGTVYIRMKMYGWDAIKALTTKVRVGKLIRFDSKRKLYTVEKSIKGKNKFIGRFKTLKEAEEARDRFIHSLLANAQTHDTQGA